MLRRIFIFWYLLFSLVYANAWGMSCHAGSDVPSLAAAQHGVDSGMATTGGCPDHCGHGGAHVLGVTLEPPRLKSEFIRAQYPAFEKRLISLYESPPVHPPSV